MAFKVRHALRDSRGRIGIVAIVLVALVAPSAHPSPESTSRPRPIVVAIDMRGASVDAPSGLYTVDPRTGRRRALLARGNGRAPLWSPDGSKVIFAKRVENKQEIWVVRSDGAGLHKATTNRKLDQWPSWSPGSKRFVVERFDASDFSYDNELFVVRADGSRERNLTRNRKHDTCPDWSPRGGSIVFVRRGDILKIDPDGTHPRHLTDGRTNDAGPKWSPDGRRILFARDSVKQEQGDLFVVNRSGKRVQRITDTAEEELVYGWSPNGAKVVFVTTEDGFEFSLWIVNIDGSRSSELVADVGDSYGGVEPNWSRDGRRIVYRRTEGQRSDLWTIRPDGSHNRRLTKSAGAHESTPSWYSPPQGCTGLY